MWRAPNTADGPGAVTARFDARFRRQTPIGATVVVRAWTLERRGRLVKAPAEVRLDSDEGPVLAEAKASMFVREPEEATRSDLSIGLQ